MAAFFFKGTPSNVILLKVGACILYVSIDYDFVLHFCYSQHIVSIDVCSKMSLNTLKYFIIQKSSLQLYSSGT